MRALLIVVCVAAGAAALYLIISYFLFRLACRRFSKKHDPFARFNASMEALISAYPEMGEAGARFEREHEFETVEMKSFDGLTLRARLLENPAARGVMVACHGYRSNSTRDFIAGCPFYYDSGFTLLLIDQRACAGSEGKYVTFGVLEGRDAADWCRWAGARYPGMPILLAGISMGATAVLMAGPDTPPAVKALVADCGFVSPWEVLTSVLRSGHVRLPIGLTLTGVNIWARLLAGFDLRTSTKDALARNVKPVLFAHGQEDDVVPPEDVQENYAACRAPAELLFVPGAGHGLSYCADTPRYQKTLGDFCEKYVFGGAGQ